MNGIIPDFIKGMKMSRFQFSRFKSYEKLPLLFPGTTYVRVRLCNTNSVLDVIRGNLVEEPKKLEERSNKKSVHILNYVKNELRRGENITNIVKELSSKSENVESIGLQLFKNIAKLKNVAPEKQIDFEEELLNALRSLKITITEEHYMGLLECYSLNKCFPNIDEFMSKMKDDGLQPSETLQQEISKCLSRLGKYKELLKLITQLKLAGVEISDSVYRECVCGYAAAGKTAEALDEYHKLRKKDNCARKELQISLLVGLIFHGDANILRDTLSDFTDLGLQLSYHENYTLLESMLESEHVHLMPYVVHAIGEDSINKILPSVLKKLMWKKKVDTTFNLLCNLYSIEKPLTMSDFEFSTSLYKTFIDYLIESQHSFSDILKKCKELRKIDDCHYVLEYLLYECLKQQNILNSVKVIEALAECDATIEQNYFWPLLVQAHERFDVEGVIQVVHYMFSVGIYPESETLLKYVFPFLHPYHFFKYFKVLSLSGRFFQFLTEVFVIYALEKNYVKECAYLLGKRPLSPDVFYYFLEEPFMKALTTRQINQEVIQILKFTNAVDPFVVLKQLWLMGEEGRMRELLKFLIMEKMTGTNRQIGDVLLGRPNLPVDIKNSIQKLMTLKSKTSPHGKEIEKESLYECLEIIRDAEIHLKELEYKKMNVGGELFRLLKYYMKIGLYVQALKIRDQLIKNMGPQIEMSPNYMACMCRLYEYEQKYEEAFRYYRLIREKYPNFSFDVPKVTGLCILFIKLGAFDELMSLLERMPIWWGNLGLIEHKMVGILRGVAALGNPQMTQTIFDILLQKNVITPTENTLQPFIETYLKMGNTDEAVKELTRLIFKYQKVPSVMHLIWNLVMEGEFYKMEEVIKTVLKHLGGKEDIIISTLRTIACLGDVHLLGKYFKIYGIRDDDKRLRYVLSWEHFGGEIELRIKALQTFILSTGNPSTKIYYADFAVGHVCNDRNRVAAEKLSDFLEEQRILSKFKEKLQNVIALTTAFGQDVPQDARRNKKHTIWWENVS